MLVIIALIGFLLAIALLIWILIKKDLKMVKYVLALVIVSPVLLVIGAALNTANITASVGSVEGSSSTIESSSSKAEQLTKASKEAEASTQKSIENEEKEAAEKAEREAELNAKNQDRSTYDASITYDQLARTPDDYLFKKIVQTGKVIQVIEDDGKNQLRVAINDNYDNIMYVEYDPSIVSQRILEDDMITFYAFSAGTISYESTMGGKITIPGAQAYIIDFV